MINLLVFLSILSYIYEDADSLIVINDSLILCGHHQYNDQVKIQSSRLTISQYMPAYDTTGWLYLQAPTVNIQDNSMIDGIANGYSGGTNSFPNGSGPGGGDAGGTSGGGGGGGAYGGNGGYGGGSPGAGGNAYGNVSDTMISMGSGGGAGRLGGVEGLGGAGGARLTIHADYAIIDSSNINCNGQNGQNAGIVAGGAGSGGGIMIKSYSCTLHNTMLSTNGGNGGASDGYGGGGGGGGRIKVFYSGQLDTNNLNMLASPGSGGAGSWGNGSEGTTGSIYIGYDVHIHESSKQVTALTEYRRLITNGCLTCRIEQPTYIKIIDVQGRVRSRHRLYDKINWISLQNLSPGVYFIQEKDHLRASFILIK